MASITDPGALKQALGWVLQEKPPHGFFNWWQNLVGDWFDYLDSQTIQQFDTVSDLVAALNIGDLGMLNSGIGIGYPFQKVWTKSEADLGGSKPNSIEADGELVCVMTDSFVRVFVGSTGVELWSWNITGAPVTTLKLIADGRNFIVQFDSSIVVLDRLTGAIKNTIATTGNKIAFMQFFNSFANGNYFTCTTVAQRRWCFQFIHHEFIGIEQAI